MINKEELLVLIHEFLEQTQKKEWKPGIDLVQYSGNIFDSTEYVAAISSLLTGWLGLNTAGYKFEHAFPKLLGKNFGSLTNSGSSANLLMLSALTSKRSFGLKPGAKVLVAASGFPTTVNPVIQLGFKPIFVDIELDTLNLNLDLVEDTLKNDPEITVMMFAHALGNPPDMDRVMQLVDKYGLIFLEDCCDALGSEYDGNLLGSYGYLSSCSFYPAHHMTIGEGGFIASNNRETDKIIKSFRDWGRGCYCNGKASLCATGTCNKRFSNWMPELPNEVFDHKYIYNEIGYNLKPIELQAAIGLEQIKKLDEFKIKRISNHSRLYNIFEKYSEYFILPKATEKSNPNWFAFVLTVKDGAPFNRTKFCAFLETNKIQTRPYFAGNLLLQPAYSSMFEAIGAKEKYPMATKSTTDTFFLGCSPIITDEQLDWVEEVVNKFFKQ